MHYFSVPHCFKIVERQGKACLQYKLFASSEAPYLPPLPPKIEIPVDPRDYENASVRLPDNNDGKRCSFILFGQSLNNLLVHVVTT